MKRTLLAYLCTVPRLALPALVEGSKPKPAQPRLTWEQHFANANTAHDGYLTLEQAKAGYQSLFKDFADIDPGGKGFVTTEDVKTWHKAQRVRHQPKPDNKPRPRYTFQPRGTATVGSYAPRADGVSGLDTFRPC